MPRGFVFGSTALRMCRASMPKYCQRAPLIGASVGLLHERRILLALEASNPNLTEATNDGIETDA